MNPVRNLVLARFMAGSIMAKSMEISNGVNPLAPYLERIGVLKAKRIISAFSAIDRVDFVPEELKASAYNDEPLPIGKGQTISQPYTVAFMLELLDPQPGEKIMDIGAGSGWQSALLAEIVGERGRVFSVERVPELCELGRGNISKYNFIKKGIVECFCEDASAGLPDKMPFDKIIAAAALGKDVPKAWKEQLKAGGKIVVPIDRSVWLYIKKEDGTFQEKEFPGFSFVPFVQNNGNE